MRKNLLVIDDDRHIREVAKASLELVGGFMVILADSGERGLKLAQEAKPDAIILDLMMPGWDGQKTLTELKLLPDTAYIPVIILTAKATVRTLQLIDNGAAGVLVKPFDPIRLPSQICEILRWSATCDDAGRDS